MARVRDYAAEYRRRQEKAQRNGWRTYGEARYAKEQAKKKGRTPPVKVADLTRQEKRNRRARDLGFKSDWDRRQKTRKRDKPIDAFRHLRSAFGQRPGWNRGAVAARTEDFEPEDVEFVVSLSEEEMMTLLTSKGDGREFLFYH